MKTDKQLGIWMDHANAHVIEFTKEGSEEKEKVSKIELPAKSLDMGPHEKTVHNKEQHAQSDYYKKLSEIIIQYDEVLLFGPTDAKLELFNMLREDHHFEKVVIETKQTDKMTDNQQAAFVKEHFSKQ